MPLLALPADSVKSARSAAPNLRSTVLSRPAVGRGAPAAAVLLAWLLDWRAFGPSELGQDGFLSVDLGFSRLQNMLAFTVQDVHPPLFYALLHVWFAVAGLTYFTAKYVVIACGVLALVILGRLAARLGGPAVGLLAVLLLALSPTYLRLSTTVRDFIPGLLFSLLTLWLTARLLSGTGGRRHPTAEPCLLAVATAAALLTSYMHFAFLLPEVLLGGLVWLRRRRLLSGGNPAGGSAAPATSLGTVQPEVFLALLGGIVLALPWYVYFLPHLVGKISRGTTGYVTAPAVPTPAAAAAAVATAITGQAGGELVLLAVVGWSVALILGVVVVFRLAARTPKDPVTAPVEPGRRLSDQGRVTRDLLLVCLVSGLLEVLLVLWRWQLPKSLATYIVVLLPLVAVLQAFALVRGRAWQRLVMAPAVLVAVAGQLSWYLTLVQGQPIDWTRDAPLNYLADHVQSGDGLIFSDHARRAQYVLAGNWFAAAGPSPVAGAWRPLTDGGCDHGVICAVIMTSDVSEFYLHSTAAAARQVVAAIVPHVGRIWFAESGEAPGTAPLGREALATQGYFAWSQTMGNTSLQIYSTGSPDTQWHGAAILGGAVSLQSAAFSSQARPGGAVLVQLVWRDRRRLTSPYTVFVHLDDAAGHLVAQEDGMPVAGLSLTNEWKPGDVIDDRHGVVLPVNVAPGSYQLHVGLYKGQQRLALPDGTNQISLGSVRVGG